MEEIPSGGVSSCGGPGKAASPVRLSCGLVLQGRVKELGTPREEPEERLYYHRLLGKQHKWPRETAACLKEQTYLLKTGSLLQNPEQRAWRQAT